MCDVLAGRGLRRAHARAGPTPAGSARAACLRAAKTDNAEPLDKHSEHRNPTQLFLTFHYYLSPTAFRNIDFYFS